MTTVFRKTACHPGLMYKKLEKYNLVLKGYK